MSKTQQRGFLWLSLLLIVALGVAIFLPRSGETSPTATPPNSDTLATLQQRANEAKQRSKEHYRSTHGGYTSTVNSSQRYENGDRHPRQQGTANSQHTYPTIHYDTSRYKQHRKPFFTVDLNTADTTDLKELRGIGHTYANRIVRYREQLGGFYCKEQLMEVYGMTDSLFQAIAPHLTLDTTHLRYIDLNSTTLDTLKRHPYIDYWQAKAVIQYRSTINHYTNPQELLLVTLIDQETFNKIKPYIVCK